MRIRTIKPEFWTDKKVATWPMETRLCFLAILSGSDDHGRGHAEAERIAAELFPYDLSRDTRETLAMVHRALATLSATSRIVLYRVGDEDFYQIENWSKHQKVDRPSNSRIEPFSPEKHQRLAYFDGKLEVAENPRETLANTRETIATGSGIRDQGSRILDHTTTTREDDDLPGNDEPERTSRKPDDILNMSEEEVVAIADRHGVPKQFAIEEYARLMGRECKTFRGVQVTRWGFYVAGEWSTHRDNPKNAQKGNSGANGGFVNPRHEARKRLEERDWSKVTGF